MHIGYLLIANLNFQKKYFCVYVAVLYINFILLRILYYIKSIVLKYSMFMYTVSKTIRIYMQS